MDSSLRQKAQAWANDPHIDDESRREIQELIEAENENELAERFYKDLEFGTGGMRGTVGAGPNRINTSTIRKACQAVADEVCAEKGDAPKKIIIAYDTRVMSRQLAQDSAGVFAAAQLEVHIFADPVPVAFISFGIRHLQASAGIMVTASHNPPEYNGFKVFWRGGPQIVPPQDENIIRRYRAMEDFSSIGFKDFAQGQREGCIHWLGKEIEQEYFRHILSLSLNSELCTQRGRELSLVYTALHGTGLHPCLELLKKKGLTNVQTVKEQDCPDGRFPTVASPNPEEPEALGLAVSLMKKTRGHMALGTDPDADRVGVALNHGGKTVYLSGNQIATLMLHYILTALTKKNQLPKHSYVVKSIVTTPLIDNIARHFGVDVEETPTGFKWIAKRIGDIETRSPQRHFLFAAEESFGQLNHAFVRDKDGPSSVALLGEMALYHKVMGRDFVEALDMIYEEFGFFHETLHSFTYAGREGAEKIGRIMEDFRSIRGEFLFNEKLETYEDYLRLPFPGIGVSNVLAFRFASGDRLYLRPSGTEPKIKFYLIVRGQGTTLCEQKQTAEEKTKKMYTLLVERVERA